jgi:hypothetical protein
VTPELVRLSIGIEDIDDILWDLDQALDQLFRVSSSPVAPARHGPYTQGNIEVVLCSAKFLKDSPLPQA